ncbi:toll/interleukin-1 receptor domain-containing protein [Alicyclobacillus kakegawensis]|uniref:toll/interleukin-1 receptor domain-containing protein n=1 Tax=Alicyclobacillus kakegawensis TaxID=392012 RepID=UPI00082F33A4|nr:toll/interleukin-1 receptor domain-containing protein [Alicyclobacillus kakegawensis]
MAKIFLSHSSKDKEFVRKLAADLKELGHDIWFDEWEIRVGDSIVSKINQGIADADYVVIVLSPNAVESGWVEREWQSKYWNEIQENKTIILPVMLETCTVPSLLGTKKYADFRKSYALGLVELTQAIRPVIESPYGIEELRMQDSTSDIADLLSDVQGKRKLLSECISEGLNIAIKRRDKSLELFCRNELAGWSNESLDKLDEGDKPRHRLIQVYVTPFQVNTQYIGWGEHAANVMSYLRTRKDTILWNIFINQPVAKLESEIKQSTHPEKMILSFHLRLKDLNPSAETDLPLFGYATGTAYGGVLEAIRTEFTKRLLNLLPTVLL